jgi:hypothetical protein
VDTFTAEQYSPHQLPRHIRKVQAPAAKGTSRLAKGFCILGTAVVAGGQLAPQGCVGIVLLCPREAMIDTRLSCWYERAQCAMPTPPCNAVLLP